MKIDKVIFSTSERFSVFWNLQAKLWKMKLGIEPVCLLFGDRSKTNMSDEHGTVIEIPPFTDVPLLIQITWSKFFWPTQTAGTKWLIGDIDLLPISTHWFTSKIAGIPDDHYVHLDADGITQLNGTQYTWSGRELTASGMPDLGCPTNMPGHYHLADGAVFKTGLEHERSLHDELKHIVESKLYQNSRGMRDSDPIEQHNLWCAEELRSTRAIRRSIISGKIKFTGLSLRHGIDRTTGDRLDKSCYDFGEASYRYDFDRLKNGKYVDLHCTRPFDHVSEDERERRWKATELIVQTAWNDQTLTR